jgi:AraC-like DNA-binding protein
MAEVAARVGFPDQAYFDRKFKQYFRSSPCVMRAKLLQAGGE